MSLKTNRINWGKNYPNLPKLNLSQVQKESWKEFLQKDFAHTIQSVSPIVDYTGNYWVLEFSDVYLDPITNTTDYCKEKGLNYSLPVRVKTILTNKRTGQQKEEVVFLLNLPTMTSEGTFIISGIERGIISQVVRSPGIYFTGEQDKGTGKVLYNAEIRPVRGAWLEFFVGRKNVIFARVNRRRKLPATIFLRALTGYSDKQLIGEFSDFIKDTIAADSSKTQDEALIEFYKKIRPGEPAVLENAQKVFNERFFNLKTYELGMVGRYKINKKFDKNNDDQSPDNWILLKEDVIETIKRLIKLQKGELHQIDDIDSLANRRVRRVGEIVSEIAVKPALARFERMVKERMTLISTKEMPLPSQMINPQPLVSALNSFFRSNQLSSILDQTNPISEIDLIRRVTVVGIGGISRERASFSIRDVHSSQYGRICTVRSPEGPNIGLVNYLALYAKINKYGFIEAPFRKVTKDKKGYKVNDDYVYLDVDSEYNAHVTHLGVNIDENGYIKQDWVPFRHLGEFIEGPINQVDYIDLVPREIVGVSASLIPFVDHDDATRALMGSHMQCQAVPLIKNETPIVGTGMEPIIASSMHRTTLANRSGTVIEADATKVVIKLDKNVDPQQDSEFPSTISPDGKTETYFANKFSRTSPYGTCFNQKVVALPGQKVQPGQLLIDGPSTENGDLSIGKNILVAYTSIDGLTFEDSFVISDRLVKQDIFTSIQIYEYEARVVDTKLGPEELTRDIPNVSDVELSKLTEDGIVMIGASVGPNDILVGKVEPRGEKELSAEERLLRAIFGEKAKEVKDTSLRVPNGEGGVVIKINVLDRDKSDELDPGVSKIVKVYVAQLRRIQEGDKISGRHGNKGVICKVMPEYDMPRLEDGTPIDLIVSPISVISRMNLGQILETALGLAGSKLGKKYFVPVFDKYPEDKIGSEVKLAGLSDDFKSQLYDGRTGEAFHQKTVVGKSYVIKLVHMVDDKVHARSTGPYSLVTQQPLGGKARMGGQRLGEMEVWALEAHRAAHILQEMLTIKSDDLEGRSKAFQAIIKGQPIPDPATPESFKVLTKELAGLAINVTPTGGNKISDNILDFSDDSIQAEPQIESESEAKLEDIFESESTNITKPETNDNEI